MKRRYLRFFPCLLPFLVPALLRAQQTVYKETSIGLQVHSGSFLTSAPKAEYLRDSYTRYAEVYFQQPVRSSGSSGRQRHWGAGIFHGNTGSRQYIGTMTGAFSFVHLPLLSGYAYSSSLRIGAGLGWIEKPYDKNTNYKNSLIGSHLNGYTNISWQSEYRLSPHVWINAGLSFGHLSNGTATLPNLGLNFPALTVGARYRLAGIQQAEAPPAQAEAAPAQKYSVSLIATAGVKQHPWVGSRRHLIKALSAEVSRHLRGSNYLGAGLGVFYNPTMEVNPTTITGEKRTGKNVQVALYAAYEHAVGRFSVPLQMGAYAYNKDIFPVMFQQLGLRYRVSEHWRVQVLLKTHTGKADFFHGGISYKLK